MQTIKILNAQMVNEGTVSEKDVIIEGEYISRIGGDLSSIATDITIDAAGKYLLPGVIDDQVHFREPGLTHKATIYTEAKAAVAGGVTAFMEMPNTVPQTLTQQLLEEKYEMAARNSLANYSFYMGVSNDNVEEVMKTNAREVCGLKIFMGSSTGNMLVDNEETLRKVFGNATMLVAVHCEDEPIIRNNIEIYRKKYGEQMSVQYHPEIRSAEACYKSSSLAVGLAKEYGTRLHVLHISTAREIALFDQHIPLAEKHITAEACIHHLWFDDRDYDHKGNFIKWNPAVKTREDKEAIFQAVLDNRIDVIATDHAPHTLEEKQQGYFQAPSGGPLVQHSLVAMLEFYHQNKISLVQIAEKMSHHPAVLFRIEKRGFIKEGYFADLVLIDLHKPWMVGKQNILYKCGWSPFEGQTFQAQVSHTFVSGHLAYQEGTFDEKQKGKRLTFFTD